MILGKVSSDVTRMEFGAVEAEGGMTHTLWSVGHRSVRSRDCGGMTHIQRGRNIYIFT